MGIKRHSKRTNKQQKNYTDSSPLIAPLPTPPPPWQSPSPAASGCAGQAGHLLLFRIGTQFLCLRSIIKTRGQRTSSSSSQGLTLALSLLLLLPPSSRTFPAGGLGCSLAWPRKQKSTASRNTKQIRTQWRRC